MKVYELIERLTDLDLTLDVTVDIWELMSGIKLHTSDDLHTIGSPYHGMDAWGHEVVIIKVID